jgi:hypothetical protein
VLVVSWLLEREYRRHRVLDDELAATNAKWLAIVDIRLQRKAGETRLRIVKVVVHPGEIENWARHAGRQVNEQARSDFADLAWQKEGDHRRARGRKTPIRDLAKRRTHGPRPWVATGGLPADAR